ncbi:leukocyte-associated immunoglobulin-like receptor 2 [Lepus europaeus]|uniref:leukocyte-associated immunoglobulin-like receptor 2 n=1 Tax=Lepus europaeus TaxID=9983 RepID=UPI002B46F6D3|nr:leukocyte-associated immunoglobulin-like receptor 2 [Lepus europaeus]
MSPRPATLLGLVLCLGQAIHSQPEAWPTPSISAEPGPPFLPGQPVTIVCRSPAGFDTFRLEKEGREVKNERSASPNQTEARFPFVTVDGTTGRYNCQYHKSGTWSERSGPLELVVTPEDVPRTSDPVSAVPSAPTSQEYPVLNGVRLGLAGVVLLILVAILAEAWHSKRRARQGCLGWTQQGALQGV